MFLIVARGSSNSRRGNRRGRDGLCLREPEEGDIERGLEGCVGVRQVNGEVKGEWKPERTLGTGNVREAMLKDT